MKEVLSGMDSKQICRYCDFFCKILAKYKLAVFEKMNV